MNSKSINRNVWALTLSLCLGVIGYSTFSAQAADAPKATKETTAAIPEPNTVKLSADPKVASKTKCPLVAWVGFNQSPTANYTVEFWRVSPGTPTKLCSTCPKTGNNGQAKFSATRPSTGTSSIQARVKVTYQTLPLQSNNIPCGPIQIPDTQ